MALADELALETEGETLAAAEAPEPVKSRCWLCCTCGHVRRSPMPAAVAAPCVCCDGLDFETVPHGTVLH